MFVTIRCYKKGSHHITTVSGVTNKASPAFVPETKKILLECKKQFGCNGYIPEDEDCDFVIQGHHCARLRQFLVEKKLARKDDIMSICYF